MRDPEGFVFQSAVAVGQPHIPLEQEGIQSGYVNVVGVRYRSHGFGAISLSSKKPKTSLRWPTHGLGSPLQRVVRNGSLIPQPGCGPVVHPGHKIKDRAGVAGVELFTRCFSRRTKSKYQPRFLTLSARARARSEVAPRARPGGRASAFWEEVRTKSTPRHPFRFSPLRGMKQHPHRPGCQGWLLVLQLQFLSQGSSSRWKSRCGQL